MAQLTHENFVRDEVTAPGSDRTFGLVMAGALAVLALFNRLWMMLGLLLHGIVNPIVMGLLFYGTILPTGLVMRLRGRDLLRLRRDPAAETYWITRTPGPAPETMRDQF